MKLELDNKIIHFKDVESTNLCAKKYVENNKVDLPVVFTTDFQTNGRGYPPNIWDSEKGKNLLISIALNSSINLSEIFNLNIITSLSLIDLLEDFNISNLSIKWPNDILIRKRKVCGILIENKIKRKDIFFSIIGAGLNVNQIKFPNFERKATSIFNETNKVYKIEGVMEKFLRKMENRLQYSSKRNKEDYLSKLYLRDKVSVFLINNLKKNGIIKSVDYGGKLLIELENGIQSFDLKEVKFLS